MPRRTYRTSEVSAESLAQALAERRVLLVHAGPRAYGTGDVWFTIGKTEDLSKEYPAAGIILPDPITGDDLASWNDPGFDSEWEFWELHEHSQITSPCYAMTAEQRLRFKQAVALFIAELIELMPFTIAADAAPYLELLRLYARHPDPELAQRVTICARGTGWGRVLFDPEQEWEREGDIEPVEPYLRKELPYTLGEYMTSDRIAETGDTRQYDVRAAADWLHPNIRGWVIDTAWDIYEGAERTVPSLAEAPKPALFSTYRPPSCQEQERRLSALLEPINGQQASWFRRHCSYELARKLKLLPEIPASLIKLLTTITDHWKPEMAASADVLADEATQIGSDALFGLPFRLTTLTDSVQIASRMGQAAQEMAVIRFRAYTQGLEVRAEAEKEAREKALDAMLEDLRRYVRNRILEPRS